MKYKAGDRVKIQSLERYNKYKNKYGDINYGCETEILFTSEMSSFCGQVATITRVRYIGCVRFYHIAEDKGVHLWVDGMFEGLVEESVSIDIAVEETTKDISDKVVDTIMGQLMNGNSFNLPQGYQFKDENGNVINATKIVLEKKKKEYPKTYEECCKVLDIDAYDLVLSIDYRSNKMKHNDWKRLGKLNALNQILICRDAYWKLYGEDMGLGKPWEPDWYDDEWPDMYYISFDGKYLGKEKGYPCCNIILIFPTAEMRDEFYENFKELINECKKLL